MWQMILVHYGNRRHEEDRRPRCLIMKKLRHNRPLSKRIIVAGRRAFVGAPLPASRRVGRTQPGCGGSGRKRHAMARHRQRSGRHKSFP